MTEKKKATNVSGDNILISYKLEDFLEYKEINNLMTSELSEYCKTFGGNLLFRDSLLHATSTIIDAFMNGKNPNDMVFKNTLIEYLNKLTTKNYATCIDTLKKLDYSTVDHLKHIV